MLIVITGHAPNRGNTRRRRAFRTLALAARKHNLECLVCTPNLKWSSQSVSGWMLTGEEGKVDWHFTTSPWDKPVVYDGMYLADLRDFKDPYRRLMKRFARAGIPVFNPTLPRKDYVYQILRDANPHVVLPQTWYPVSPLQVMDIAADHAELWVKPVYGSGGRNMLYIRRQSDRFQVVAERFYGHRVHKVVSSRQLQRMLTYASRRRPYMAQEHVALVKTADGRKVDFRFTVVRDHKGRWVPIAVTAKLGSAGSILTNFHAGGSVRSLTQLTENNHQWLTELNLTFKDMQVARSHAVRVAGDLQKKFPTLAMLGVDIGFTNAGQHYIYDFNGRPGRDILTNAEMDIYMKSIAGFGKFLENAYAGQVQKPGQVWGALHKMS